MAGLDDPQHPWVPPLLVREGRTPNREGGLDHPCLSCKATRVIQWREGAPRQGSGTGQGRAVPPMAAAAATGPSPAEVPRPGPGTARWSWLAVGEPEPARMDTFTTPAASAAEADAESLAARQAAPTAGPLGRHPRALRTSLPSLALLLLLIAPAAQAGSLGAAASAVELMLGASRWNPAWVGGAFWNARPWVWGWYRSNPGAWAWWAASSAAWGLSNLAAANTLTALVQQAIAEQATVIVVPQSDLRLDFGSLQAVRPMGVRFAWAAADGAPQQAQADCQAGLLNGAPPADPARAQLLNAACHVAYGSP